jgi:hypothetical protein
MPPLPSASALSPRRITLRCEVAPIVIVTLYLLTIVLPAYLNCWGGRYQRQRPNTPLELTPLRRPEVAAIFASRWAQRPFRPNCVAAKRQVVEPPKR